MGDFHAGIDLGTTFTAAAVARDGRVEMVRLGADETVIPSLLLLREDGTITIGHIAEQQSAAQPDRLARNFKRQYGDMTPLFLGGAAIPAHLLHGQLLHTVVEHISRQEAARPSRLAITHPANWSMFKLDLLRQAVDHYEIGEVALLSEPGAAAIHYASLNRVEPGTLVAVYDLGGGTFDAAVLRKTEAGFELVGEPKGVEHLGGIDFDAVVYEHVRRHADGALDDVDTGDPEMADRIRRLREDCVKAKHVLSSVPDATVPVLLPGAHKQITLTRQEFERAIRPTLDRTIVALRQALSSAAVSPGDLDRALLVGGSSRIPLVAQLVGSELGIDVAVDTDPKNAVAKGAALFAAGLGPGPAPKARRGRDVEVSIDVSFAEAFTGATRAVTWDDQARQVDIPAGVSDGERLRFAGEGSRGQAGGPSGDLTVTVAVGEDADFGRDGADLLVRHLLTSAQAEAGGAVTLRTPAGDVDVPVPAGTEARDSVRVAGAGFPVPGTGDRGDLVATLDVAPPPAPRARDGDDVEVSLELTFDEAYHGASRRVAAGGDARTVEIPAGVADGARLSFPGLGHPGMAGGNPGDLYVTAVVAEHPDFGRDGADLLASHRVAAGAAEEGATVSVSIPGGEIPVEVPVGSRSGDEVRVAGQGFPVPGSDRRGDLVVSIEVSAPEEPVRGADIDTQVKLSLEEAFTGVEKRVLADGHARVIEIPAGVHGGERLRFEGKGNPGVAGGPPGDLNVTVRVGTSPHYRRRNHDLLVTHTLTAAGAAAGGRAEVQTPAGRLPVSVTPGTGTGAETRVPEQGFPDRASGRRGDLVVSWRVEKKRLLPTKWLIGGGVAAAIVAVVALVMVNSGGGDDVADTAVTAARQPEQTTAATEPPAATEPGAGGAAAGGLAGTSVTILGPNVDISGDAVDAALQEFAAESGIAITYTGTQDFLDELNMRLEGDEPPDIAIFAPTDQPAAAILARAFPGGNNALQPPPGDLATAASDEWGSWMEPGVVDGTQFTVPIGQNAVSSLVWHKPAVFAANGYTIPQTWQGLLDLTDSMIGDGFFPWCVGIESGVATGFPFAHWVEEVLLRFAGADFYDRWASHEVPFDSPEVAAAWNEVLDLWNTPGAVLDADSIATISAFDLGEPLMAEDCLMHRQLDFYDNFFPDGTTFGPEGDVSVFYLPSVSGDRPINGFGAYAGAFRDAPEVWAVVEFMASARFGELTSGPFLSANKAVPADTFSPIEREIVALMQAGDPVRLHAAETHMPDAVGSGSFWSEGTRAVSGEISVAEALANIEASFP